MDNTKQYHRQLSLWNRLITRVDNRRYEILLVSFLLLIFGDTFAGKGHFWGLAGIYQNMLIGLLIFYRNKWIRYVAIGILLLSVSVDWCGNIFSLPDAIRNRMGLFYLLFFFLVAKEVYREVLYTRTVSRELLAAALCGFVLLCLIATFMFFFIETEWPGSFTNVGTGRSIMDNINYFSFTTLLTIGFGDIAPVTILARRAVMLMGLTGHFYTVFITSIIIGKYLSSK